MRTKRKATGPIDEIAFKLSDIQKRMMGLENQKITTVPVYENPLTDVVDPFEGMVALCSGDLLMYWYVNGDWHTCRGLGVIEGGPSIRVDAYNNYVIFAGKYSPGNPQPQVTFQWYAPPTSWGFLAGTAELSYKTIGDYFADGANTVLMVLPIPPDNPFWPNPTDDWMWTCIPGSSVYPYGLDPLPWDNDTAAEYYFTYLQGVAGPVRKRWNTIEMAANFLGITTAPYNIHDPGGPSIPVARWSVIVTTNPGTAFEGTYTSDWYIDSVGSDPNDVPISVDQFGAGNIQGDTDVTQWFRNFFGLGLEDTSVNFFDQIYNDGDGGICDVVNLGGEVSPCFTP